MCWRYHFELAVLSPMMTKHLSTFVVVSFVFGMSTCENSKLLSDNDSLLSNEIIDLNIPHDGMELSHVGNVNWLENQISGGLTSAWKLDGCRNVSLCCQGKNNSCIVRGRRSDKTSNDTCYCDEGCLALGDCCWDYIDHCPALDCVVNTWGEWNKCDTRCGFGVRQRFREITQEPKNGGKRCQPTVQKQVCEGTQCIQARASGIGSELKEIGRILQSEYSQWRNDKLYDPYKDIRKNIFLNNIIPLSKASYCALYTLKSVRFCHAKQLLSSDLKNDATLCVECQPTAMHDHLDSRCLGHGVYKKETSWTLFGMNVCRGTWVMETQRKACSCKTAHPSIPSYSFV